MSVEPFQYILFQQGFFHFSSGVFQTNLAVSLLSNMACLDFLEQVFSPAWLAQ